MALVIRVNGDDTQEAAQNWAATARITWRSFRNGGPDGPISSMKSYATEVLMLRR